MFTYVYFHFRCFKCDHNTLSLHPRKAVWGDYVVYQPLLIPGYLYYIREKLLQVEMTYCIQILPPPSPLFHKEKRSVVKSFKLTRKCQQISGFLFNTSEKYIFFQNILKGQLSPLPPPRPSASYGLVFAANSILCIAVTTLLCENWQIVSLSC